MTKGEFVLSPGIPPLHCLQHSVLPCSRCLCGLGPIRVLWLPDLLLLWYIKYRTASQITNVVDLQPKAAPVLERFTGSTSARLKVWSDKIVAAHQRCYPWGNTATPKVLSMYHKSSSHMSAIVLCLGREMHGEEMRDKSHPSGICWAVAIRHVTAPASFNGRILRTL